MTEQAASQSIALHQFIDAQFSSISKMLAKASEVAELMQADINAKAEDIKAKDEKIAEQEKALDALRARFVDTEVELETARSENIVLTELLEQK